MPKRHRQEINFKKLETQLHDEWARKQSRSHYNPRKVHERRQHRVAAHNNAAPVDTSTLPEWEQRMLAEHAAPAVADKNQRSVVRLVPKSELPRQFGRRNKGAFARS